MRYTNIVLAMREPNEPEDFTRPTLNDDLSIRFEPIDGDVVGPIIATAVVDYVFREKRGKAQQVACGAVAGDGIFCFLTESRVVCVCPTYDDGKSPGTARAGHLKFPWISAVGFRTKQNWLTVEALRLFYETEEGPRGLDLMLDENLRKDGKREHREEPTRAELRAPRFNPPPNWPPPPHGWTPTPGWQPDSSWPPAPAGWKFWVD